MERKIPESIEALRELLQMSKSATIDDILEQEDYICICNKCNQEAFRCEQFPSQRFVRCPNCNYIVLTYHLVDRYWICTITDDKGAVVTDCNGNPRMFEGEEAAKDYIKFCDLNPKLFTINKIRYHHGGFC